jgi:hypothetical protein
MTAGFCILRGPTRRFSSVYVRRVSARRVLGRHNVINRHFEGHLAGLTRCELPTSVPHVTYGKQAFWR